MLGVKVELNASSVLETKRKFNQLLTQLQDRANKSTIKLNIDFGNLRQLNGMMNTIINDMRRVDNQNKQSAKTMQDMSKAMKDMLSMQQKINGGNNNGNTGNNFGLGNLAEWLLLRKGIQLAMTEVREGIQFAVDMNKAMTEISIVTGMNQREVGLLAQQYNVLAKSMGVTTTEIAKASVEYYRQGLTTEQVNERMKQTIQYAKVSGMALEEASTVLTATVNSMEVDIKRASDVFAYLGDATATGADEIGRAFQKVGGTASALGVEFEKVSSWIAVVSSKTREGAETIGNSFKNVMARYQQIRERGFAEEDGTQVNQVSKALNEVGIQIMDTQGQFRNFGTIMDELGGKWANLDSKHKAYIATTLAGTNQQSRFLNLMNNYGESVDLYNQALDSAGTTQQKYNLYMQGTEAHLNKLKATAEGVWLKIFNGKDIQDAIDNITGLVGGLGSLIDKFGTLPTLLATISTAFFAFSKNMKQVNVSSNGVQFGGFFKNIADDIKNFIPSVRWYNMEWQKLNHTQGMSIPITTQLKNAFAVLKSSTIAQTVATGALEVATVALNAVIGLVAGLAISAVVAGISKLINATKEARENVERLTQSYQQSVQETNGSIQSLSSLKTEYDELSNRTNLTAEETSKLHNVQNQIAQIAPELIDGYDKQGNAILKVGVSIDEVIEKLKEKNRLEAVKTVGGYDDAKKVYNKDAGKAQNEIERLNKELQKTLNGGEVGYGDKSHYVAGLNDVRQKMAELATQGKANTKEYQNLAKTEEYLDEKTRKLNLQIEEQRGKLSEAKSVLEPFKDSMLVVSKGYDDLSDGARRLAKELVQGISPDSLSLKAVQDIVDKLSGSEMQKAVESVEKLKMDKGKKSTNEYNEELVKILDSMHEITGVPIDKLEKMFNVNQIQDATSAIADAKQAMQEYTSQFDGATNKIQDYNKFIDEMNDKHMLSATSVKSIMEKYPELLQYLGNEADFRSKLAGLIQNEQDVQATAYSAMLQMSEQFYNEKVKGTGLLQDKLGQYYTSDLENYKSLAEMKSKVDSSLIKDLASKWGNYFSLTADGMLQVDSSIYQDMTGDDGVMSRATVALNRQIANTRKQLDDVANRFKNITLSVSPINFDKINLSKTTTGGGGGSTSSTSYESKLDGMDKFTAYLDDINTRLEKQDDLISDIADKAKIYKEAGDRASLLKALELETQEYSEQSRKLATLKQDTGLVGTQMTVLAQTFKRNWSAMSGADLSSWTRTDFNKMFEQLFPTKTFKNKSQQEAYENQKKFFNQLTDDWFKYSDEIKKINNDILSTQNDMVSLMQERYETYFSVINGDFDELTTKINEVKYSMDLLGESENFNERERLAQNLIAITTTYRDTIQNAVSTLINHRDTLQQGSVEWTVVNNQINEYKQTLQDANIELKDASDLIQQIQQQELDTASGVQDKIVDALKNKYNKAKQDELDAVEEKKQKEVEKANGELDRLRQELEQLQDDGQEKKDQLAREKAELELWKKDNSVYAQGKIKEKEANIKNLEKELAIDAKEKEIDEKEKELDAINETADAEEKRIEDKYKKLLDDKAIYAEALKIMETQSQEDILALLQQYDERYSQLGTTLGKAYSDALLGEIKKGMDALKSMQDGMAGAITPTTPNPTPTPPSTPDTPTPITPPETPSAPTPTPTPIDVSWDGKQHSTTSNNKGDAVRRIQENLNAIGYNLAVDGSFGSKTRSAVLDYQRKHGLKADGIVGSHTWASLIKFDTGGYTGDFDGSENGKLAVLHKKERVLNQAQTSAFEHLIYDILPKFYNNTAMNKLDAMASVVFNEPIIKNDIKITNNTPFDVDNNMDNLGRVIKQELRTSGFRMNLVR